MGRGEICANDSDRTGSWANDYTQQTARNQRLAVGMLASSGVSVVAAGFVYAFTSPERWSSRRDAMGNQHSSRPEPRGI